VQNFDLCEKLTLTDEERELNTAVFKKDTPFDRVPVVLLDFCLPLFDGESSFAPLLHRDDVPVAVRVEPISAFFRRPLLSSSPGSVTGIEIALK
jgi:hypothetical protein